MKKKLAAPNRLRPNASGAVVDSWTGDWRWDSAKQWRVKEHEKWRGRLGRWVWWEWGGGWGAYGGTMVVERYVYLEKPLTLWARKHTCTLKTTDSLNNKTYVYFENHWFSEQQNIRVLWKPLILWTTKHTCTLKITDSLNKETYVYSGNHWLSEQGNICVLWKPLILWTTKHTRTLKTTDSLNKETHVYFENHWLWTMSCIVGRRKNQEQVLK